MKKLFKIPLAFLLIASCIGLLLRFQLTEPLTEIVYPYLLHAHSHVMFLGWVFNVLIIAFTMEFSEVRRFKQIFWFFQLCVAGMLFSFPLQGYGTFSIILSTLHTIAAFVFIARFFNATKKTKSLSLTLAKAALLFFALSSIGPFALAYLKANGLDHSKLYRFSIYFYLHFQYNGFFLFGILSLLMKLLEAEMSDQEFKTTRLSCQILIFSCLPAYFLSILWAKPAFIFNIIGFLSAIAQLVAISLLVAASRKLFTLPGLTASIKTLFACSLLALVLKSILQLISAHPSAALFANEFRSIVIAYLHLVLVGGISLFLMGWLMIKRILEPTAPLPILFLLFGFLGSEALLAISPWYATVFHLPVTVYNTAMFSFSVSLTLGLTFLSQKHLTVKRGPSPLQHP